MLFQQTEKAHTKEKLRKKSNLHLNYRHMLWKKIAIAFVT